MPSAERENRPDDATCVGFGLSPENGGVLHIVREVADPEVRLRMLKIAEGLNATLGGNRQITSLRQCGKCATVFTEMIDDEGVIFLHERLRPLGQFLPPQVSPDDRPPN